MKLSYSALAAVLALGLTAGPALAKKEPPAAAAPAGAPKLDLSKPFIAAAQPLQKAITAKDYAAAKAALPAAEAAASKPDEKYVLATIKYQIANGLNDRAGATAALTEAVASNAVPEAQKGQINFQLGFDAYQARDYSKAISYMNAASQAGFKDPQLYLVSADAHFRMQQYAQGVAVAQQGIALQEAGGQKASEDFYQRTYSGALNSKDDALATSTGAALIRHYPNQQNWRSVLVSYRDSHKLDPQIALDLFRLMRVTKSVAGERDYYEYAALAVERGLPGEAKSVADEGFSTGVPRTSRALSEVSTMANQKVAADLASLPAAATRASASASGRTAMATGDAYLAYGQDAKAAALYRVALAKGTDVDASAANMRLGIALARSGDKAGARAAFALVQGARLPVAQYWLLYLDMGAAAAA